MALQDIMYEGVKDEPISELSERFENRVYGAAEQQVLLNPSVAQVVREVLIPARALPTLLDQHYLSSRETSLEDYSNLGNHEGAIAHEFGNSMAIAYEKLGIPIHDLIPR